MASVLSIGIFKEPVSANPLLQPPVHLIKKLDSRRIRTSRDHAHTHADPFLFTYDGELYLFAEVQMIRQPGYLNVWKAGKDGEWADLGVVLKGSSHYSYPFVFEDKGELYLLPESSDQEVVALYRFTAFPLKVEKVSELLKGKFVDSNILRKDGLYYLVTSIKDKLYLYVSEALSKGYVPHPASPIPCDGRYARCGGGLQQLGNKIYRIAQDNQKFYGAALSVFEVEMSPGRYSEKLINPDYKLPTAYPFQAIGRHHLSWADMEDSRYIAIDGLGKDYLLNKLINAGFRII